ncbi:MAG: GNAT family N-acetyltransferase [Lachnospiraceae bacterium]
MNIVKTCVLDQKQQADIARLCDICKSFQPVSLTFPVEDGDAFFLLYDNQNLVSALSLFLIQPDFCESVAFTLPALRRKGYFSLLLDTAEEWIDDYEKEHTCTVDWCFVCDHRAASGEQALKALQMELWNEEYQMELPLADTSFPLDSGLRFSVQADPESETGRLVTASCQDVVVGSCRLLLSGPSVYFYEFQVKEELRGQTFGTRILQTLLCRLKSQGIQTVSLQVSGLNTPALALYRKTGFRITETLSYYLY